MILLDTHIWVWAVQNDARLTTRHRDAISANRSLSQAGGLALSVFSCWEVAKLVEKNRITLPYPIMQWITAALAFPGLVPLNATPEILVESTQLPGPFHADPADRIIVATARVHDVPLLTEDNRILSYPHVKLF